MREFITRFLLPVAAYLCFCIPGEDAFAEAEVASRGALPARRPGLWRISTVSAVGGLQVGETCVGLQDSIIGPQGSDCAKPEITRADDQIVVTVACGSGAERIASSLLFTGDFATWYRAQGKIATGDRTANDADLRTGFTIDAMFLRPDCNETAPRN
ncbi:DUF3617 domain-containing protein [Methylocystis heyeri]|uniref:DUF3617 family protein n=1 Tax=Methylocystis heyeri TaxID=391905 RepID=A0A6B8KCQ7_9HYPH|nr:DUF3617 family protein [Methylocystis heyeri]QGM46016.1 hypothetical protein H2LOC_010045 [Methylocystis heyeri]